MPVLPNDNNPDKPYIYMNHSNEAMLFGSGDSLVTADNGVSFRATITNK